MIGPLFLRYVMKDQFYYVGSRFAVWEATLKQQALKFELLCVAVATEQFDQFRSKVACFCFYALMRYLDPRNKEGEEA